MDEIRRFSFIEAPIRGQWVRLSSVLTELDGRRTYPGRVRNLLGEMLAAVTLVADNVKFRGAVALQSRGSGPLTTVLAECRERHLLRGLANWSDQAHIPDTDSLKALIGDGQLALNLIPDAVSDDAESQAYQGLVALSGDRLAVNLESYFAISEQLPTRLSFAGTQDSVTGLLLQRLPGRDNATEVEIDHQQALWEEVQLLAATLREEELAGLDCESLITRLFGGATVRVHPPRALRFQCTCNRDKTSTTLLALGRDDLLELLTEQEAISVTCEICGALYAYDAVDVHQLFSPDPPAIH
ncbi:MAG: Hsp33 family molecular chaperone HslO [Pseudomonadales bacterium]